MATVEDRLREWIDRDTQALEARGVDYLKGYDWFQVDPAEQEVFGLDPDRSVGVLVMRDRTSKSLSRTAFPDNLLGPIGAKLPPSAVCI